jgi:hypothetical protein
VDAETASLIVSPLAAFAGVGFGAWLNHRLSRSAVKEEREWVSTQQVQARKEAAAAQLDAAVLKVLDEVPQGSLDTETRQMSCNHCPLASSSGLMTLAGVRRRWLGSP